MVESSMYHLKLQGPEHNFLIISAIISEPLSIYKYLGGLSSYGK